MDTKLLFAVAATSVSAAIVYYHIKKFSYWSSRNIKGPQPWPIMGTNIYFLFWPRTVLDVKWRQQYGKVYGIYNGYKPVLRVSDNQLIKHVFIKEFKSFTDRNNTIIYGHFMRRFLLWSAGEHWSNQRALITPMFTSLRLKTMFSTMTGCVERFMEEINSRVKIEETAATEGADEKKAHKSGTFTRSVLMALTLDVIASSFFSLKLNTYRDETSEFFKRAYAFATFDFPWFCVWLLIPTFVRRKFQLDVTRYRKYEYFDKLTESTLNERRENESSTKGKRNDFIQMLKDAKISDKANQTEQVVHSEQDDVEAHYNDNTGHQELDRIHNRLLEKTTSSALTTCLYELSHQQQAQNEVYEELVAATAAGGLSTFTGESGYSTLLSLTKLDAFISETLRMYAPLNEHNRQVTAPEGVVLPTEPPLRLPHKAVIAVPVFVVQRDEDYWQDPLKFDMTRFYPENRANIKSCSYMPFGVGPRNCVGLRFALLELKLALAHLLLKYQVSPGPKTREYPPKFKRHFIFVQLAHNDFKLDARAATC